ncbi:replication initiation and membrane attachment family protein [Oceanobacillus halotolerans]|uniref:replication initiation and membrane attachment family protein n=1 Tax=Oceanobacillus halotolerans TaxID=2663380 RepID=UPI0013DA95CE|nr:DnaD domain protein [Oceanobacillus halotolerans]
MLKGIGKILPIDGYRVSLKGTLPNDYSLSLTHLYQPLIGLHAVTLYQTLLHELQLQQHETIQTHHTLMNYLNMPLDKLYRARLKLEGIGLLRTYEQEADDQKVYFYELLSPFTPIHFFQDAMLSQLHYHHIGADKHRALKDHFIKEAMQPSGKNITASFYDVFQTFHPSKEDIDEMIPKQENVEDTSSIDFSWIEQMLKQRMIPHHKVLTPQHKKLIFQMMTLYDLSTYELEKAVLWALTDENVLDAEEFKVACHDLFKAKHQQKAIQLTEKSHQSSVSIQSVEKPTTKEEQLIYELERISPKQLLEDLSNGNQASEQDMKIIREVMTTQGLPAPVMNVLIHYVLLQTNMKLSKAYMEKIASHWSRANLQTAKEAMAFAKQEKKRFQDAKNKKQNYYKKTYQQNNKEVVPDWFKNRKKKQAVGQETANGSVAPDEQKEREEIAAMLREFSSKD